MIPEFNDLGNLPPGIRWASWQEFKKRFGFTPHLQKLLKGLEAGLKLLSMANYCTIY